MLTGSLVPRESVQLVNPKCRCSHRASSQGNQSSRLIPSADAHLEPRPKGISQVGLSQVSMLTGSLVPRESVKLVNPKCRCSHRASSQGNQSKSVYPKCRCSRGASSQGNQSSWLIPSVDAHIEPRPKGISPVGYSQVTMLTENRNEQVKFME